MTNEEMLELARRAVACEGWQWMAGMAVVFRDGMTNRVTQVQTDDVGYGVETYPYRMAERMIGDSSCMQWREHEMLPDLTDPATLGCLLELVREAHDCSGCFVMWDESEGDWSVNAPHKQGGSYVEATGHSEAEALVAALEVAE